MAEHKGFNASERKLRESRKKGQVLKSQLLTQAAVYLSILFSVFIGLENWWLNTPQLLEWCLRMPLERLSACALRVGNQTIWVILGSLVCGACVAVLLEFLQVGLAFHWEPVCPQLNRLNPGAGLKRIAIGLCKSWLLLLKLLLVILLARQFVLEFASSFQSAMLVPGRNQIVMLLPSIIRLCYLSSGFLLLIGAIEYLFNRHRFRKEQSMSLDDVRRESREDEGDPHVKTQRRALHEAMAMQEMIRRVRSSKVIIVD